MSVNTDTNDTDSVEEQAITAISTGTVILDSLAIVNNNDCPAIDLPATPPSPPTPPPLLSITGSVDVNDDDDEQQEKVILTSVGDDDNDEQSNQLSSICVVDDDVVVEEPVVVDDDDEQESIDKEPAIDDNNNNEELEEEDDDDEEVIVVDEVVSDNMVTVCTPTSSSTAAAVSLAPTDSANTGIASQVNCDMNDEVNDDDNCDIKDTITTVVGGSGDGGSGSIGDNDEVVAEKSVCVECGDSFTESPPPSSAGTTVSSSHASIGYDGGYDGDDDDNVMDSSSIAVVVSADAIADTVVDINNDKRLVIDCDAIHTDDSNQTEVMISNKNLVVDEDNDVVDDDDDDEEDFDDNNNVVKDIDDCNNITTNNNKKYFKPKWMFIGSTVMSRWTDGLFYMGLIVQIDITGRRRCLIQFEDSSLYWIRFDDLHKQLSSDSVMADSDILCALCRDGRSRAPNEIVICDVCNQGYHQKCHKPRIGDEILEPDIPWTCRLCVFALGTKDGGAERNGVIGRALKHMKQELPYDLQDLHWDASHETNTEETYCYCGGNGNYWSKMLQCLTCLQWFHEACIQSLETPLLYGDLYYNFKCAVCSVGSNGREQVKRITIDWSDMVALVINNLALQQQKRFFDLNGDILPFVQNYGPMMRMSEDIRKLSESQLRDRINDVLNSDASRFVNGREVRKKHSLWALRIPFPFEKPLIFKPAAADRLTSPLAGSGDSLASTNAATTSTDKPIAATIQTSTTTSATNTTTTKAATNAANNSTSTPTPLIYGACRKGAAKYPALNTQNSRQSAVLMAGKSSNSCSAAGKRLACEMTKKSTTTTTKKKKKGRSNSCSSSTGSNSCNASTVSSLSSSRSSSQHSMAAAAAARAAIAKKKAKTVRPITKYKSSLSSASSTLSVVTRAYKPNDNNNSNNNSTKRLKTSNTLSTSASTMAAKRVSKFSSMNGSEDSCFSDTDNGLGTTSVIDSLDAVIPVPKNFDGPNNPFVADVEDEAIALRSRLSSRSSLSPTPRISCKTEATASYPTSTRVVDVTAAAATATSIDTPDGQTIPKMECFVSSPTGGSPGAVSGGGVGNNNSDQSFNILAQRIRPDGKIEYLLEWQN